MTRHLKHLAIALVLVASACAPAGTSAADASPTTTSTLTSPTSPPPAAVDDAEPTADRLASHVFMATSETRSIAGLGELIEIVPIHGLTPVAVQGTTISSDGSGISCLRFRYRVVSDENEVQTLCVVVFDETGDCSGYEPLDLDLNTLVDVDRTALGDAQLLQSGELFAACTTDSGSLRLQPPNSDLPRLYFTIVDALGGGPYSLGDDEHDLQRNGHITTYGNETLRPSWIVTVSREIAEIEMTLDGSFVFNSEDCSQVPSCTDDGSVVGAGDVFRTSLGLAPDQLEAVLDDSSPTTRDEFFIDRIGFAWDDVESMGSQIANQAFGRLAVLDIMDQLLVEWDAMYGLRSEEVIIAYWQPWFVERTILDHCPTDAETRQACESLESAIGAHEADRIGKWRDAGFRLWQAGFIGTSDRLPLDDRRPHWRNFDGVIAGIGDQDLAGSDLRTAYGQAVRDYADEIGQETPVMLFMTGGPLTAQTKGEFCEADLCPSDFARAYEMAEGALVAALESFSARQFRGFGVGLFDGSHFDIGTPVEDFGYPLNRVGETGYNHPILNPWRAS